MASAGSPVVGTFRAYGLEVASCVFFPELLPSDGPPQVRIRYGEVPQQLPDAVERNEGFDAAPGEFLMRLPGIGRYWVRHGDEITIDRDPAASDDDVRIFLLGSGFGALLYQRGCLPLHGCTIQVDDGCIAIIGSSGAGKSTMALALQARGYACLGDDVCPIQFGDDGQPYAAPAYPQAKLCVDAMRQFGLDEENFRRIRPSREKRAVPLVGNWRVDRLPLRRIYIMSPWHIRPTPLLQPLSPIDRIQALRLHAYRPEFVQGLGLTRRHFQQITQLAASLPVTRIVRPTDHFGADWVASELEVDFKSPTK